MHLEELVPKECFPCKCCDKQMFGTTHHVASGSFCTLHPSLSNILYLNLFWYFFFGWLVINSTNFLATQFCDYSLSFGLFLTLSNCNLALQHLQLLFTFSFISFILFLLGALILMWTSFNHFIMLVSYKWHDKIMEDWVYVNTFTNSNLEHVTIGHTKWPFVFFITCYCIISTNILPTSIFACNFKSLLSMKILLTLS